MSVELDVGIEHLEGGGYLAQCFDITGCHAEGQTIGQAIDYLRDVARVIYELCQEKGLVFIDSYSYPLAELDDVV